MTKGELIELIENYHEGDDIVIMSPGEKELVITGLNHEKIYETGKVVISTEWLKDFKPKMTEVERLREENEALAKKLAKAKAKTTTNKTGKRGRPKKN